MITDSKKVVCVTKSYKSEKNDYEVTYEGGVIIGEVYDVIDYYPNLHPYGRFRIKGKFNEQRIMSDIYPKELFITLEQHRENQLYKIL